MEENNLADRRIRISLSVYDIGCEKPLALANFRSWDGF